MISTFPLDLMLVVEEAAEKQTRLKVQIGNPDDDSYKGWPWYVVPVGFGWRRDPMEHGGPMVPCLLHTGLPHSRAINWVAVRRIRNVGTIPSHSPGRKSISLWQAPWAK